jgi:hypothetical protein
MLSPVAWEIAWARRWASGSLILRLICANLLLEKQPYFRLSTREFRPFQGTKERPISQGYRTFYVVDRACGFWRSDAASVYGWSINQSINQSINSTLHPAPTEQAIAGPECKGRA